MLRDPSDMPYTMVPVSPEVLELYRSNPAPADHAESVLASLIVLLEWFEKQLREYSEEDCVAVIVNARELTQEFRNQIKSVQATVKAQAL